jgi:hypothetical protein
MNSKPSDVNLILTVLDWKNVIRYLKDFVARPTNSQWLKWSEKIIDTIKSSATAETTEQAEMSVILKPSSWRAMQTVLKPANKNDSKDHKELLIQQIQNALTLARQSIIVTTGDIKDNYEIVGPIYFQISNKGIFSNQVAQLSNEYRDELAQMQQSGQLVAHKIDWSNIYSFSVGQNLFEQAFYVSVQELKKRAMFLDADGIVAMRQDIDLDTTGFQFFYLQIYGTAVRLVD